MHTPPCLSASSLVRPILLPVDGSDLRIGGDTYLLPGIAATTSFELATSSRWVRSYRSDDLTSSRVTRCEDAPVFSSRDVCGADKKDGHAHLLPGMAVFYLR